MITSMIRVAGSAACALGVLVPSAFAQIVPGAPVPRQFIVQPYPGENIYAIAAAHNLTVIRYDSASNIALLQRDGSPSTDDDDETLAELLNESDLEDVEQNLYLAVSEGTTQSFFVQSLPSYYSRQQAIVQMGVPAGRTIEQGRDVVVAVLDTGVSPHPQFAHNLLPGYNAITGTSHVLDVASGADTNLDGITDGLVGHGTMAAGLVQLLAPRSKIMPIKVLDSDGFGNAFALAQGVRYALDHGAHIINISLITPVQSEELLDVIDVALDAGVIVIASIGNTNQEQFTYPAAFPRIISVAAVNTADRKADFSDYASFVRLSAPGVDIVGTLPGGGYGKASGTSFSAALVSGAAALVHHHAVGTDGDDLVVWNLLHNNSVNIDNLNPNHSGKLGLGRVWLGPLLTPACSADIDDDGNPVNGLDPDNAVSIDDLISFLIAFEDGSPGVDLDDDGANPPSPDGGVDVNDLIFFLGHFEAGC
jgi:Subtilase family